MSYIGNKKTKELHISGCRYESMMNGANAVFFRTIEDAIKSGYNGCHFCLPAYDTSGGGYSRPHSSGHASGHSSGQAGIQSGGNAGSQTGGNAGGQAGGNAGGQAGGNAGSQTSGHAGGQTTGQNKNQMYNYLGDYPQNREMGWSAEIQGVSHDDFNWYFTQNGNIWKFPLSYDLNKTCKNEDRANGIFKNAYGYRLGDCDCFKDNSGNWWLFVPVTEDGQPYIAVFDQDLNYVAKTRLNRFLRPYHSVHWCAINPKDRYLYTSDRSISNDFTNDTSPVMVYEINFGKIQDKQDDFLTLVTFIRLYDSSGKRINRTNVQGGCFDNDNHLHINNGEWTLHVVGHDNANVSGGISVFSFPPIPNTNVDRSYRAKLIASSNQNKGFRYQFNETGEEPSGITYWNLNGKKVGGKVCGCFHAIMSDNKGTGADDFYFKHYERMPISIDESFSQSAPKSGVIITALTDQISSVWDHIVVNEESRRRQKNQELISGLYENRNIDYTIIENMPITGIKQILGLIYPKNQLNVTNYIYINCHGWDAGLRLGFYPSATDDGERRISYQSLKSVFNRICGLKVIMIDSCHSGAAVDELGDLSSAAILASAESEKTAKGDSVLGGWATRYWACGAGYDFLPGAADDMEADKNKDGQVTLGELFDYTNSKLKFYSRTHRCVIVCGSRDTVIFK